jgi:hypothetical protein
LIEPWLWHRLEEADQLYRQSYDIVLSELGPEHPRVATALIQLGNMANLLGKLHQVTHLPLQPSPPLELASIPQLFAAPIGM